MTIKSDIPQIYALRERVEKKYGKKLSVHSDFVELTALIEMELRQHISETTLERVRNCSTRTYDNVSLRTLDVLSQYASDMNWDSFCKMLKKENKSESEAFNAEIIFSCSQFILGEELQMKLADERIYIVGRDHGLTTLKLSSE